MSNVDIVRDFIDTWSTRDIDRVMAFFDEDAVYHNMPLDPVSGRDAIRAVIEGFAGPASAIEWVLVAIAQDETGRVLTERLDRFEIGGRWVELPVMGSFALRDGRIAQWRDYFDLAQFTSQMPSPS